MSDIRHIAPLLAELQDLVLKLPDDSDREHGFALIVCLYDCWQIALMGPIPVEFGGEG